MKHSDLELPAPLMSLLGSVVDRELATRLTDVMTASARCIDRLAAINLKNLEPAEADEGAPDLTLWEKMAPAVGETVVAINELCTVIDECFPQVSASGLFVEEGSDQRAEVHSATVFRAVSPLLRQEVSEVGALMRRPELMSSPWGLLGELQRLRSQLRERVSDGVYLAAGALGALPREDVVPGVAQEVLRALSFRGTESALRRTAVNRLEGSLPPAELASAIGEDLEALSSMPAWRHVKIETKRSMLRLRERLRAAKSTAVSKDEISTLVWPMLDVLEKTSADLTRTVLVSHDRQARDLALRRTEQARLHLQMQTGTAGWALEAAIDAAAVLRGCDESLDEVLRAANAQRVGELPSDELTVLEGRLSSALQRLSL